MKVHIFEKSYTKIRMEDNVGTNKFYVKDESSLFWLPCQEKARK